MTAIETSLTRNYLNFSLRIIPFFLIFFLIKTGYSLMECDVPIFQIQSSELKKIL